MVGQRYGEIWGNVDAWIIVDQPLVMQVQDYYRILPEICACELGVMQAFYLPLSTPWNNAVAKVLNQSQSFETKVLINVKATKAYKSIV